MNTVTMGLIWYVVFLFSTVFHEAAHSWAAYKMGDPTAYEGGQVSLNPAPHIKRSPFGLVFVPLFTFYASGWMMGWASAPYDPHWALQYPRRAGWMSLAGPAANLILVVAAGLMIHAGLWLGVFREPDVIHFSTVVESVNGGLYSSAATLLSIVFSLNLLLCLFNLLPFPPLDGSGAMTLLLTEKVSEKYLSFIRTPQLQFISFYAAWKIFDVIFDPVHLIAINLLYPGAGYH
ncbi:MAG TPA: site-2 protease family protein [bacterium]|nr:site-2 protease family protein [bacterium]